MLYKVAFVAAAGAQLAAAQFKPIDGRHDPVQPPIDDELMERTFVDNLPSTAYEKKYWEDGSIPESCKDKARYHNQPDDNFTVFEVKYSDCEQPWIFCRAPDAANSEDSLIDIFGRLPVHMRQYINHPIALSAFNSGVLAETWPSGEVVMGGEVNIKVLAHELSHNVDIHGWDGNGARYSEGDAWAAAYAQDSASPTDYGSNLYVEDFAEIGMIATFQHANGDLQALTSGWTGFGTQLDELDRHFSHVSPGGQCDTRMDNSAVSAASRKAGKVKGASKSDISIKSDKIKVINPADFKHLKPVVHKHDKKN